MRPRDSCALYGFNMTNVRVKINDAGLRKLYQEVAAKIDEADRSFRETHTGYPVEVIAADAPNAFPWLELSDWTQYATAVANNAEYVFELR